MLLPERKNKKKLIRTHDRHAYNITRTALTTLLLSRHVFLILILNVTNFSESNVFVQEITTATTKTFPIIVKCNMKIVIRGEVSYKILTFTLYIPSEVQINHIV